MTWIRRLLPQLADKTELRAARTELRALKGVVNDLRLQHGHMLAVLEVIAGEHDGLVPLTPLQQADAAMAEYEALREAHCQAQRTITYMTRELHAIINLQKQANTDSALVMANAAKNALAGPDPEPFI